MVSTLRYPPEGTLHSVYLGIQLLAVRCLLSLLHTVGQLRGSLNVPAVLPTLVSTRPT